jgi:hypothetical protein
MRIGLQKRHLRHDSLFYRAKTCRGPGAALGVSGWRQPLLVAELFLHAVKGAP